MEGDKRNAIIFPEMNVYLSCLMFSIAIWYLLCLLCIDHMWTQKGLHYELSNFVLKPEPLEILKSLIISTLGD